MKDADLKTRGRAERVLQIHLEKLSQIDQLKELSHKDYKVRCCIANILGAFKEYEEKTFDKLALQLLSEEDLSVSKAITEAMYSLAYDVENRKSISEKWRWVNPFLAREDFKTIACR